MEVENYLPAAETAELLALLILFCQQWQLELQEVNSSGERLCESDGLI